jgi:hypothetical protein
MELACVVDHDIKLMLGFEVKGDRRKGRCEPIALAHDVKTVDRVLPRGAGIGSAVQGNLMTSRSNSAKELMKVLLGSAGVGIRDVPQV